MYEYRTKVSRVVDGDTVDVDIDLGFGVWMKKERIRLLGIDTPESRTRDLEEKALGLAAKDYVSNWLTESDAVYVKTLKDGTGKYGRILGYIYADEHMAKCLNDDIIGAGHGVPYYGGKR